MATFRTTLTMPREYWELLKKLRLFKGVTQMQLISEAATHMPPKLLSHIPVWERKDCVRKPVCMTEQAAAALEEGRMLLSSSQLVAIGLDYMQTSLQDDLSHAADMENELLTHVENSMLSLQDTIALAKELGRFIPLADTVKRLGILREQLIAEGVGPDADKQPEG